MCTVVNTGRRKEDGGVAFLSLRLRLDEAMKAVQQRGRIVDLDAGFRLCRWVGVTLELPAVARDRTKKVSKRRDR
jgi:hypothetical protein